MLLLNFQTKRNGPVSQGDYMIGILRLHRESIVSAEHEIVRLSRHLYLNLNFKDAIRTI